MNEIYTVRSLENPLNNEFAMLATHTAAPPFANHKYAMRYAVRAHWPDIEQDKRVRVLKSSWKVENRMKRQRFGN